ncbi:MAG: Na+:solute symporter [Kiritimatiellae bacterium]|nr:Na+:solute symporter [Kiritimatiellia bacterium]
MKFVLADWIAIAAFFAILLVIPVLSNRRASRAKDGGKSSSEFFQSGRSMPWWLIGISMVAAMTSTNSANLFTQLIRENGLAGNWAWWSFLSGGVLVVFVYAKLWHRSGATTDISFYELRYAGRPAAFLRAFRAVYLGVIYNLLVMATVLLGAVKLGTVLFGVPAWVILAVTAVASVLYSTIGGIRGTIYADFYLFAVIMIGAVAVMAYGVSNPEVGGYAALMKNASVAAKTNFLPDFKDTDTLVAVFVVPVAIQWWNVWYSGSEPGGGGYIVQRMLTAKTPNHALGGTLFAQVLQYALRPWPWYIVAFASIIVFPDLESIRRAFPGVDPKLVGNDMAYPAMIKFVPAGWLGVVAASLMGALFSTIAAQISMGSNYVANDVWKRFVRKGADGRELIVVARVTSVALMAAGCLLVPFIADAKAGFDLLVMVGAGTGAVFLLRWFWMRINAWTEIAAMAVSIACAVFFQMAWPAVSDVKLLFWHRLLLTIGVTTVAWLAATFMTRPEPTEVLADFKARVRAKGRDVGMGVLWTFLVSLAIFALMWAIGAAICLK